MVVRLLILSVSFLTGSAYLARASQQEPVLARQSLSEVPMQIQKWHALEVSSLANRVVEILGVDDFTNRVYEANRATVGLYIGFYQSQREGRAIHSPMNCLPGAGWNPVSRTTISIPVAERPGSITNTNIEVNRITIQKGLDKQVVLYWYQSHGRIVASEYWGKIYTVLDTIRINRTDAALVRVISPVLDSGVEAEKSAANTAVDFVQSLFPMLSKYLPE